MLKGDDLDFTIGRNHIIITKRQNKFVQAPHSEAQPREKYVLRGSVTDSNGEPIIGATVKQKDTSNATITDLDGKFILSSNSNAPLIVSYIGFSDQEIKVTSGGTYQVTLHESSKDLAEVVVVGFGVQKKANLTGAVNSIDMNKALGDRPISSVTAALQGAAPGLRIQGTSGAPGSELSLNIRGTNSINGGNPLVLVNNVPMDINMISPQDIESISVLKDAASASIYGARAAFGVILITTKEGKKGSVPQINYNNNFAFSTALELPQKASPLESVLAYKNMGWANDTYVDGKNINEWEAYIRDYNANPSKYVGGYVYDTAGNLFLMRENNMFDDMMAHFGFMQNHNVSVNGGGNNMSYRVSLGYTDEDGILITKKDRFRRVNFSGNINTSITPWLSTQADVRYASSKQNKVERGGRNGVWGSAMQLPSYQNTSDYEMDGITYPAESSATYIKHGDPRRISQTNLRALGRVVITPFKGFTITGEYTFDRSTSENKLFANQYKYIGLNFSGVMNSVENTFYETTNAHTNYNALNLYTNYNTTFGKNDVALMVGYNQEKSHYEDQFASKTDILLPNLPSLSGATGTATVDDHFSEYAIRGLFYRLSYSYDGRYLFETNGRYDGTSRFAKGHRFGFFPSFSAGWRLSEEKFMNGTKKWLSNFKLRVSYGSIGNQVVADNYPYIPAMNPYLSQWIDGGKRTTTLQAPPMVSSTFTWEKVYTIDFGVDVGLLNNRLTGSFDWYRRDTRDMLAPGMDLPWVIGANAAKQNAADMKTPGWELEMNWRDRIKEVSYYVGFNIYDSQSEITKFNNETGLLGTYRKGMKLGEIWGYVTDRFYTEADFNADGSLKPGIPKPHGADKVYPGDVLYKNLDADTEDIWSGNGTVDAPGDRKVIGNSTPRYIYAINAGIGWKGFDLSLFLQGVGKRDFWRTDQMAWPNGGWGSLFKETLNFWSADHTDAYYPRTYANDGVNTERNHWVQSKYLANASYLRLQNITLSYTFPKMICEKLHISQLKVFASGENLYTWDHLPEGLEPEMLDAGAWQYPFMKKISFGVNITL
jgi:TonB-linked SusC/RagA family outer membrane protein